MKIHHYFIVKFFFALYLFSFYACANVQPLSGGIKDEIAPRFDSTQFFTPNFSTNFQEKKIQFTLNEWVELNDATNQVLISPPLKERPSVKLKGKTVVLSWKEDLRPTTTYSVYFGESVRDITEKNVIKDLRYVFSTGEVIDSLSVGGRVLAKDTKDFEKATAILYESMADSMPYKARPYYIAKISSGGGFLFENLHEGTYQLVVLSELNKNFLYDQDGEKIGFYEYPLVMKKELKNPVIQIDLFAEAMPIKALNTDAQYRQIDLTLNNAPNSLTNILPLNLPSNALYTQSLGKDNHLKFYFNQNIDSLALVVSEGVFKDTVYVRPNTKSSFLAKKPRLVWADIAGGNAKLKNNNSSYNTTISQFQHPNQKAVLHTNHPIYKMDTSKIKLYKDSTNIELPIKIGFDAKKPFEWSVEYNWKDKLTYKLMVLPNAIEDYFELKNTDTLQAILKTTPRNELSSITAKISGLDSLEHYFIELYQVGNDTPIKRHEIKLKTATSIVYKELITNEYKLKLTQDSNKNGVWDTGDFKKKRKPEKEVASEPLKLRANWDAEIELKMNNTNGSTENSMKGKKK